MNTNDTPAQFTKPSELRLVRTLPGPIERIWAYLIDPEKRARWFCGGALEARAGGKVVFHMVHKNLAPNETPPAQWTAVQDPGVTFEGRVLRCEPPRFLSYTFGSDDSVVNFELTEEGNTVTLVLTHRVTGPEEEKEVSNYASGWHIHLAHLIALLTQQPQPPFWSWHATLIEEYRRQREHLT